MIIHAHTAYDGTRTYREGCDHARRGRDVAYAGCAAAALNLSRLYPAWRAYGSPTQDDGLFLLVAPGHRSDAVPLDPGPEGWIPMEPTEIEDFTL